MIKKRIIINFFFIFIILITIFFYGHNIYSNKGLIELKNTNQNREKHDLEIGVTKFTNVEYKSYSKDNKSYITKGNQAYIYKDNPDLITLNTVNSYTKLKDNTVLDIKSNKAQYYKNNKNIKYYDNVVITNKNRVINAKIANFFANENLIKLETVVYNDGQNLIKADLASLDTLTSNLEMKMKNKKDKVYGKRKQK